MVRSCLIEPLVKPLVGRGTPGAGRRTALARSRIAASCLALSALVAVSTAADASRETLESEALKSHLTATVKANAHRIPEVAPKQALMRFLALVAGREDDLVRAPGLSLESEQVALRQRQQRPYDRLTGLAPPGQRGLSIGRRLDLLSSGADPTFRLFGSGIHLSGIPTT